MAGFFKNIFIFRKIPLDAKGDFCYIIKARCPGGSGAPCDEPGDCADGRELPGSSPGAESTGSRGKRSRRKPRSDAGGTGGSRPWNRTERSFVPRISPVENTGWAGLFFGAGPDTHGTVYKIPRPVRENVKLVQKTEENNGSEENDPHPAEGL